MPSPRLLLEHHPTLLSVEEVVRHIAPDPVDLAERHDVLEAILELAQTGLAHRLDGFVFPTVPAVGFAQLQRS